MRYARRGKSRRPQDSKRRDRLPSGMMAGSKDAETVMSGMMAGPKDAETVMSGMMAGPKDAETVMSQTNPGHEYVLVSEIALVRKEEPKRPRGGDAL